MPLIKYKDWRPSEPMLKVVGQAISIIEDPEYAGFTLTLRQLYYQFVARGWIPNTVNDYKRLGRIITDAREAGLIDWLAIEDRGRNCYRHYSEESGEGVLQGIHNSLQVDLWAKQDRYVEVWVEKESLGPTIARPCNRHRVSYMACKGYLSASEAWRAGMRFEEAIERGKNPILFHLGDHDPSGIDMTRDNRDRLELFARMGVEVRRLALNWDQVEEHSPPPNPAKQTDSRFEGYKRKFGDTSWELDALRPSLIDGIIDSAIRPLIDFDVWNADLKRQEELREPLRRLSDRYDEVVELAMSAEKPLQRLKRLTALVPEIDKSLLALGNRTFTMPIALTKKLNDQTATQLHSVTADQYMPGVDDEEALDAFKTAASAALALASREVPEEESSDRELRQEAFVLRDNIAAANARDFYEPGERYGKDKEEDELDLTVDPDEEDKYFE